MSSIQNKNERSAIPLMILVATALIGPMIYMGFASLYHFVIVGLLGFVVIEGLEFGKKMTAILIFFLMWTVEALVSTLWSPDKAMSVQYVYYIFLIAAMCLVFHYFLCKQTLEKFAIFMVVLLLILNIIAIWETITGKHVLPNYLNTGHRERLFKYVPGTFYYNPNDFATFAIQAIPFSLLMSSSKKKIISILSIFNIVATLFTIAAAQARIQLIVIMIIYLCFVIMTRKSKLLWILVIGAISVIILYNVVPKFNELINEAFFSISTEEISASAEEGGSLSVRINLLRNGFYILIDTFGFGIGAGCHRSVMLQYAAEHYATGHVSVMHNILGELFTDYGILIGGAFLIAVISSIKRLFIIRRKADDVTGRFAVLLALNLGIFIICGMSSSSIIQQTSLWMTLCFTSAFIKIYTVDKV